MNACGACIRTRANTGKSFCGSVFHIFARFVEESMSVRTHTASVFTAGRLQENSRKSFTMRAELVAYMIYLEGLDYPEYVMHFYLKYSGTPYIGIC